MDTVNVKFPEKVEFSLERIPVLNSYKIVAIIK